MSDDLMIDAQSEPDPVPRVFDGNSGPEYFGLYLSNLAGMPVRCLQIGVFAGEASRWLLQHVLTHPDSVLFDVDTWAGSPDSQESIDFQAAEAEYDTIQNPQVQKRKGTSDAFFATNTEAFDFVFVDSATMNRSKEQVLADGQRAIDALVPGGIVAFDDTFDQDIRAAVDELIAANPELEQIDHRTHQQMWFRRA